MAEQARQHGQLTSDSLSTGLAPACRTISRRTACATPTFRTSSKTVSTRHLCNARPGIPGPRRRPATPRSAPITPTGCCAQLSSERLLLRRESVRDEPGGGLPVASAVADGRAGHIRHHRVRAAAGRTRGRVVTRAGLPPGCGHTGTVVAAHV